MTKIQRSDFAYQMESSVEITEQRDLVTKFLNYLKESTYEYVRCVKLT